MLCAKESSNMLQSIKNKIIGIKRLRCIHEKGFISQDFYEIVQIGNICCFHRAEFLENIFGRRCIKRLHRDRCHDLICGTQKRISESSIIRVATCNAELSAEVSSACLGLRNQRTSRRESYNRESVPWATEGGVSFESLLPFIASREAERVIPPALGTYNIRQ